MFVINDLQHAYGNQTVLKIPSLAAEQGSTLLVSGQSGSGKTTLLHILAAVLPASSGKVEVAGTPLNSLSGAKLDAFRGEHIGLVFQQLHLISALTALENLTLAQYLAGHRVDAKKALDILAELDAAELANKRPAQLSQGQRQRVAIARAVVNAPELILADEPTASLDDQRCHQVLALLQQTAKKHHATLVVTSHDQRIKSAFTQQFSLDDGGKA